MSNSQGNVIIRLTDVDKSFDDERVVLHDMQYPLFQKEMDILE